MLYLKIFKIIKGTCVLGQLEQVIPYTIHTRIHVDLEFHRCQNSRFFIKSAQFYQGILEGQSRL